MSRYVYRSPSDVPARAVASGGQNVIGMGAAHVTSGMMVRRGCSECVGPVRPMYPNVEMDPYPVEFRPWFGATQLVAQPPPHGGPPGSVTVSNTHPVPISPAPAPTVAVSPQQTALSLPQPGTTLDSSGASVTTALTGIEGWLAESTLITGFPNWGVAAAGALAVWMLMGRKGGRR